MQNAVSRFWKSLSREQKLSVGLFCVCAIVAGLISVVQIRRNILYPFTAPVDQLVKIKEIFGPSDEEKIAAAKKADADGDGLSDWDEENRYRTSPYLADTDSDGVNDNLEIAKGTDPNCPTGRNCGYVYTPEKNVAEGATASSTNYGSAMPLMPERSASAIRVYLQAQGVSSAQLAGYTDEMLLQAYDQSVSDFNSSKSSTGNATSTTSGSMTTSTGYADGP